jgi:sugar lactone lactonase YvrE
MHIFARVLLIGLLATPLACDTAPATAPNGESRDGPIRPTDSSTPASSEGRRLDILATGAEISGANGIHFGPDGRLYVATVIGSEIVVVDPDEGGVLERISEGVDGPDDIAFGSDGSFYWTSILTGEVAGMRPDGTRITAARLSPGVNPITFSPDGRLFVSQCFFDDKLYEVDPAGVTEPRLLSDRLGPGCGLNGMDWGPDGRLYGPRWFRGEIVSFDVDRLDMRLEASGFEVPAAVKFDSKGRLHVLDTAVGAVYRVEGDQNVEVASFSPGLDNFAFDATDRLFVSSFVDGFVVRANADGSQSWLTPGGMSHPGGLTILPRASDAEPDGLEIVVADLQSIRGFDAQTGDPTRVERNIFGVSEIGSVSNIATDDSNLILTSWLDGTVKIWDPAARELIEAHHDLAAPVSAIRYAGRLVIAEHGKGRVVALPRPMGANASETSETQTAEVFAANLPAPTGLTVRGGDLFVSDFIRGEVLRIAADGMALETPEIVAAGLKGPEGVVATADGFLVVEGVSGRILAIDSAGKAQTIGVIEPGSPAPDDQQPPSMIFGGLAFDGTTIYVAGEQKRVVYRLSGP